MAGTQTAGSACCALAHVNREQGGGSSLPADGLSRRLGGGEGCPARLVFAGETLGPVRSLGNVGVAALAHTSGRPGDHKGITTNDQYRYRLPTPRGWGKAPLARWFPGRGRGAATVAAAVAPEGLDRGVLLSAPTLHGPSARLRQQNTKEMGREREESAQRTARERLVGPTRPLIRCGEAFS